MAVRGPGRGKQSQRPASRIPGSECAPQPPSALGPAPRNPHAPGAQRPKGSRRGKRKSLQNPSSGLLRPPLKLPAVTRSRGKEAGRAVRAGRGRGGGAERWIRPNSAGGVLAAPAARARGGRCRAWAAGRPPPPPLRARPRPGGGGKRTDRSPDVAARGGKCLKSRCSAPARFSPGCLGRVRGGRGLAADRLPTDPGPAEPRSGGPRLRKDPDGPGAAPGTPGWPGRAPCRRAAGRGRRRRGHAWPAAWPRRCLRAPRS